MDINLLRTVSIMRDLNDEELSAVASLFTLRQAQPKERILEEGTVVSRFYIVCEGVVHVRRLAQKREILFGRLGPGQFLRRDQSLRSGNVHREHLRDEERHARRLRL
jgi:CRP-like cAMP-binding protein